VLFCASKSVRANVYAAIDAGEASDKPTTISVEPIKLLSVAKIEPALEYRILFEDVSSDSLLQDRAQSYWGQGTGDLVRFRIGFWEVTSISEKWSPLIGPVDRNCLYGGREWLVKWEQGQGELVDLAEALVERLKNIHYRGSEGWGKKGVAVRLMGDIRTTIYTGEIFDLNVATVVPDDEADLEPLFAFAGSQEFSEAINKIDKKLNHTNRTLLKVPFEVDRWREIASREYPNGLPKPHSNDPTQWLFDGHPRGSADPNVSQDSGTNSLLVTPQGVRPGMAEHPLQVAVARLLGYRWPRQTGSSFMDCPAVSASDEVDRSGIIDNDGIVSLSALAGEADASTRLRDLIRIVWGPDYGEGTIRDLLAAEDASANDLSTWLADEFFDGHCNLFHQTPFIWHIWDGVRGGFSALVNYHRLCEGDGAGRRLLEKLRDSYLGEWIAIQRRALAAGEASAEGRLIAAEHLRDELTQIIEGEPPYDIFVRWRPLHRQPIGWEPDIDDGVRINIRPFLTAKPRNSSRRDACILRVTPSVKKHAGADRGTEPSREKEEFPWFWADDSDVATENFPGGPDFKGRRYNDFHYTRDFKQRARGARAAAARGAT
jgi:hypothetical protein